MDKRQPLRRALPFWILLLLIASCDRKNNSGITSGPEPGRAEPGLLDRSARSGAPSTRPTTPSFKKDIAPLLTRYCIACHDQNKARGGVILTSLGNEVPSAVECAVWEKVAHNLRSGRMPPASKPHPVEAELDILNAWLDLRVFGVDCDGKKSPGRVSLRRLNRSEYDHTIHDLLGIDFHPAAGFPVDDAGYGFDTIGDVLTLSPMLMEKYLAAAESAVYQAFELTEIRERILNPTALDVVSPELRAYPQLARSEARKRVRRPAAEEHQDVDPRQTELERGYLVLRGFADRAYRRPITHDELTRLLQFVEGAQRNGEGYEQGIRLAIQAILASPHFLFRVELDQEPDHSDSVYPVSNFELATRLSYFLWSSMPDEELFRVAAQGKLHESDTLALQVRRMLADGKALALVEDFGGQWLQTRRLVELAPDVNVFPGFDESLRAAMVKETELFFATILREDRSLLDFLDADYTFVNDRLAKHYGIAGVQGNEFRRVSLSDTARGGVLTQGSILTLTSNPTRTSPVKRGKWILDNVLGTPPSPPPPNVEQLREDKEAALSGTLRRRLERHLSRPECASCHAQMDPLGFGLENFDGVGAWRTREGDRPIDASGTLPDGASFAGPAELRLMLMNHRLAFVRCLAEKMLTYALGRGLGPGDRCAVDGIVRSVVQDDYRISALIQAVVQSDPFQMYGGKRAKPL